MLKERFRLIQKLFPVVLQLLPITFIRENSNLASIQVLKFDFIVRVFHPYSLLYQIDRGYKTCGGRPGSLGYEKKDANTYAAWGVDYLKLDSCDTDSTPAAVEYAKMRDALNATGRPIFYSLCGE